LITAKLFWLDFHHVELNLYKLSRMLLLVLSSTSPKGPMSLLHLPALAATLADHTQLFRFEYTFNFVGLSQTMLEFKMFKI